jgi:membrane-associated phospholipid phosphatase
MYNFAEEINKQGIIPRIGFEGITEDHNIKNVRNERDERLIENQKENIILKSNKINDKKIIEVNNKNPLMLDIMLWISNTVSIMYFSLFVTLLVTKNIKWFYIILSVFIILTCVEIFKIISMHYDYKFLKRPGVCISNRMKSDVLFYENFVLEEIFKKIDRKEYEKNGFPSIHLTIIVSIIAMTYLFFPKYRKIMKYVSPIYIILVGYSRMYLNCHTLIQVIAGTIVGILGGKLMYNLFK